MLNLKSLIIFQTTDCKFHQKGRP